MGNSTINQLWGDTMDRLMFGWEDNLRLVRVDDRPIYCGLYCSPRWSYRWPLLDYTSHMAHAQQLCPLGITGPRYLNVLGMFKLNLSSRSMIQQQRHGIWSPFGT
jgi:hypothetical protein